MVSSSRWAISVWLHTGGRACQLWAWCSANPTTSPACRRNRAVAVEPSILGASGQDRTSTSAPPRPATPPSMGDSRGWISPYSGRGAYSSSTSTRPWTPQSWRSSTPGGAGTELVAALVAADRHRVDEHGRAGRGPQGRLQHHGRVAVATGDLRVADGPNRPVTALLVQDMGEHRRAVKARETQPVNRAAPADQRRRAAVGQQGVVTDRQRAHRVPSRLDTSRTDHLQACPRPRTKRSSSVRSPQFALPFVQRTVDYPCRENNRLLTPRRPWPEPRGPSSGPAYR